MMNMVSDTPPVRETPDIETSSDGYAARFSGHVGEYLLSVQERGLLELLRDERPLEGRGILDIGGGHAQLAGPLLAQGCHVSIAGSDERCFERTRRFYGDQVHFYEGDLVDLPVVDRAFDTVTSVRLISHMENWQGLVAEICRIADCTIIIDYPTYASLNLLSLATFPLKKMIEKNTRAYRSFWDSEIQASFASRGFQATKVYRQFTMPMALHRLFEKSGSIRSAEEAMRKIGVTSIIGNPVLLRLDRAAS